MDSELNSSIEFENFVIELPAWEQVENFLENLDLKRLNLINQQAAMPLEKLKGTLPNSTITFEILNNKIKLSNEETKNLRLPNKEKISNFVILAIIYLGISLGLSATLINYFELSERIWPLIFGIAAMIYTIIIESLNQKSQESKVKDYTEAAKLSKLVKKLLNEKARRLQYYLDKSATDTLQLISVFIPNHVNFVQLFKEYKYENFMHDLNISDIYCYPFLLNFFKFIIDEKLKNSKIERILIEELNEYFTEIISETLASREHTDTFFLDLNNEGQVKNYFKNQLLYEISLQLENIIENKIPSLKIGNWLKRKWFNLILSTLMNIFGSTVAVTAIVGFVEKWVPTLNITHPRKYGIYIISIAFFIGSLVTACIWFLNFSNTKREWELNKIKCKEAEARKKIDNIINKKIFIETIYSFLYKLSLSECTAKNRNVWTKNVENALFSYSNQTKTEHESNLEILHGRKFI